MKRNLTMLTGLAVLAALLIGCGRSLEPQNTGDNIEAEISRLESAAKPSWYYPAPSPLVTVSMGPAELTFWPYTGQNFSGTPQDPINLIFVGQADPRDIRAALLSLDGDRTAFGFDDVPPFNDVWDDALAGDVQTGYGEGQGWTGGCVQLACGDYGPLRVHMRLFRIGAWTVANAHFEMLIPGTTDHQVLSWELAEQMVIVDFMRSQLLDPDVPMVPTDQINESPFGIIPAILYNQLPEELKAAIGGPAGQVEDDVPIGTDGHAMILNLAGGVPWVSEIRHQQLVIDYDIIAPKPFCNPSQTDLVQILGPVYMEQTVELDEDGVYKMSFYASGELNVTPVSPAGETLQGKVREKHAAILSDKLAINSSTTFQKLLPASDDDAAQLFKMLKVSSNGGNIFWEDEKCFSDMMASQ